MLKILTDEIMASQLSQWVQTTYWLWPVLEIFHFFGLTLLMGGLILIDLRMMGFFSAISRQGIKKLLPPEWDRFEQFAGIHKLEAVPVATVQLRYDGWVTEVSNESARTNLQSPSGLDNLLYTSDADFSCFADLALTSPVDYQREGLGSLLQCVLTPGDPWIPKSIEEIVIK